MTDIYLNLTAADLRAGMTIEGEWATTRFAGDIVAAGPAEYDVQYHTEHGEAVIYADGRDIDEIRRSIRRCQDAGMPIDDVTYVVCTPEELAGLRAIRIAGAGTFVRTFVREAGAGPYRTLVPAGLLD